MNVDFSDISYLISDWDGTIIDSMPAKTEAFTKIVSSKFPIDSQVLRKFYLETAGRQLSFQIRESVRQFANAQVQDVMSFEEEFYKILENAKFELFPGAKDFLIAVKQRGIKLVIWSATVTQILGEQIAFLGLDPLVDYYIATTPGNDELIKGPPLFKKIAEHFGISEQELAQKSLVIGDGNGDISAGKLCGAKTAAFRLAGSPADFNFTEYSELLNQLPDIIR